MPEDLPLTFQSRTMNVCSQHQMFDYYPSKVQASVCLFWYGVQILESLDKVDGNFSQ